MSNSESYSHEGNAAILLPVQRQEVQSKSWSLSTSVKNAVTRFVNWIDNVDVDGQEYWS
jgi:RAB protein geranylgeranyltransferase component A